MKNKISEKILHFYENYTDESEFKVDISLLKMIVNINNIINGNEINETNDLDQFVTDSATNLYGPQDEQTLSSLVEKSAKMNKIFTRDLSIFRNSLNLGLFFEVLYKKWKEDIKNIIALKEIDCSNSNLLVLYSQLLIVDKIFLENVTGAESLLKPFPLFIQNYLDNKFTSMRKHLQEMTADPRLWDGELNEFEPPKHTKKFMESITGLLNKLTEIFSPIDYNKICNASIESNIVELFNDYMGIIENCDNIQTAPPEFPPYPAKKSSWGFNIFAKRKNSVSQFIPVRIYLRIYSLQYLKNELNSLIITLSTLDINTECYENLISKLDVSIQKMLNYLTISTVYYGAGTALLNQLYGPTFTDNPVDSILPVQNSILIDSISAVPDSVREKYKNELFMETINCIKRVLVRSGQPKNRLIKSWEFQDPKNPTSFLQLPLDLSEKIEQAYVEGNRKLKIQYLNNGYQLDLIKLTASDIMTGEESKYRMVLPPVFRNDINYLYESFGDSGFTFVSGVDSKLLQKCLNSLEDVMRCTQYPTELLVLMISNANEKEKSDYISIIKHRIDDPKSVRIASNYNN